LQIWGLPESTNNEDILEVVQSMLRGSVLHYLRLLINYHFRAACDYFVDDRVEDRGELLVGKGNPALGDP
jgi:hypothetical protein